MTKACSFQVPAGWLEPSLHSSYLKLMLLYNGYSAQQIGPQFRRPPGLYSYLEIHNIIQSLNFRVMPEWALGFGLQTSLAAQGLFGQAAAASNDLGQAMSVMATYLPTRNNLFTYRWAVTADGGQFCIQPRVDLHDYQQPATLITLVNLVHIAEFLSGRDVVPELTLSVPWDIHKLPSFEQIEAIQVRTLRNTNEVRLSIPTSILERENLFADGRQFRFACMGCDEELSILRGRVTERVKSIITIESPRGDCGPTWRSLQEVSEQLSMSSRTLNRKLKQENTSYSQLLDEVRSELACWYLKNMDLSVADICGLLGYSDETNFARTFKRWHYITPMQYRKKAASTV